MNATTVEIDLRKINDTKISETPPISSPGGLNHPLIGLQADEIEEAEINRPFTEKGVDFRPGFATG